MKYTCGIYLFNVNTKQFIIGHVTNTDGAFSIPKGCFDENDVDYFSAAQRELLEETNINLDELNVVDIFDLNPVPYKGKTLIPYLVLIDEFPGKLNNIRCTSMFTNTKGVEEPEIDYFKWVTIDESKFYLPISQKSNLERIKSIINNIDTVTY